MLDKIKPLNQRADTIVEVMIVLAVLGMAIGISYATANSSLLDARQAQENAQATELLQAQVENLRVLASNDVLNPDGTGNPDYLFNFLPGQLFCIYNGHVTTPSPPNPLPNYCQFENLYDITISYTSTPPPSPPTPTPLTGGTFRLTAQWDEVGGPGKDTVTMSYRYYHP
jgi:type II secretory pathway pseudopilin PulG